MAAEGPSALDQMLRSGAFGAGANVGKTKSEDEYTNEDGGGHIKAMLDRGAEMAKLIPGGGLLGAMFSGNSAAAGFDADGVGGKKPLEGLLGLFRDVEGFLGKLFNNVFLKTLARKEDHTDGVGGGPAIEALVNNDGPAIEPATNNVSFQDLVGDAGSHGRYSVADVAGPSAPMGYGNIGSHYLG